jgi:hypothetical protein
LAAGRSQSLVEQGLRLGGLHVDDELDFGRLLDHRRKQTEMRYEGSASAPPSFIDLGVASAQRRPRRLSSGSARRARFIAVPPFLATSPRNRSSLARTAAAREEKAPRARRLSD